MFIKLPNVKYLHECFAYDLVTGLVTWRLRPRRHFDCDRIWRSFNGKHAGREAFTMRSGGYRKGKVGGREVFAHRVVWKMQTGKCPQGEIDHIDGRRDNNAWHNLRVVCHGANMKNTRIRQDNSTGVAGVTIRNGRFCARVQSNGKRYHLGYFVGLADAEAAVLQGRKKLGMHPNHGGLA